MPPLNEAEQKPTEEEEGGKGDQGGNIVTSSYEIVSSEREVTRTTCGCAETKSFISIKGQETGRDA
jgi:hypothetical protein